MDVHIERRVVKIPEIRNARQQWSQRETLLVRLTCKKTGITGYGEASPLPGFSLDTIDDAAAWLHGADLSGLTFHDTPDMSHWVRASGLGAAAAPSAARFCLESAFLTGSCAVTGETLEEALFRLVAPEAKALVVSTRLASRPVVSATLLDVLVDEAEEHAQRLSDSGLSVFKVKVGRDLPAETLRIKAITHRLQSRGRPVCLRLDANQSLSLREFERQAALWRELPIEYVEEPWSTTELGSIAPTPHLGLPLAFDESLATAPELVLPWLETGQVGALVCKPMYLGGVLSTNRWFDVARAHQLPIVLSHLFDGPRALRVYQAMARVFAPGIVAGLAPHPALAAWQLDEPRTGASCD